MRLDHLLLRHGDALPDVRTSDLHSENAIRQAGCVSRHDGALAQLGEHLLCKQGVIGSIPFTSTKPRREARQLIGTADLLERLGASGPRSLTL